MIAMSNIALFRMLLLSWLLIVHAFSAHAQQAGKIPRLGVISPGSTGSNPRMKAFEQALRDLGYIDGKNISLEKRFLEGREDHVNGLAADLISGKVDAVVGFSHFVSLALKKATKQLPIIFLGVSSDPVGVGLVESLARPGGNVTGVALQGLDLIGKRVELIKETVPKIKRWRIYVTRSSLTHQRIGSRFKPSLDL